MTLWGEGVRSSRGDADDVTHLLPKRRECTRLNYGRFTYAIRMDEEQVNIYTVTNVEIGNSSSRLKEVDGVEFLFPPCLVDICIFYDLWERLEKQREALTKSVFTSTKTTGIHHRNYDERNVVLNCILVTRAEKRAVLSLPSVCLLQPCSSHYKND